MQKTHVERSFPTDKDLQSQRRPFVLSRGDRWGRERQAPGVCWLNEAGVTIASGPVQAQSTAHQKFKRILGRSMARRAFWFLGEPDRCEPVSQSAKVPLHFEIEMQSAVSS